MTRNHLPGNVDIPAIGRPMSPQDAFEGRRLRARFLGVDRPGPHRGADLAGRVLLGRAGLDRVLGRPGGADHGGVHDPAGPVQLRTRSGRSCLDSALVNSALVGLTVHRATNAVRRLVVGDPTQRSDTCRCCAGGHSRFRRTLRSSRMASFLDRERSIAGPGFNRWLVPPAALAIHLCIGQAYATSVYKNGLVKNFDAEQHRDRHRVLDRDRHARPVRRGARHLGRTGRPTQVDVHRRLLLGGRLPGRCAGHRHAAAVAALPRATASSAASASASATSRRCPR